MDRRLLSSVQAAAELGLSDSRVRALARSGAIRAQKIGSRWLIDADALAERQAARIGRGRPFRTENAWGLLLSIAGEDVAWLPRRSRRNLQRRRAWPRFRSALARMRGRARTYWFRGTERARDVLRADPDFVTSGVSVAGKYGIDIRSDALEGYYPESKLRVFEYRFALDPVSEAAANVVVHAVRDGALLAHRRSMPAVVAAVDLLESSDARSRRAGEKLLRKVALR